MCAVGADGQRGNVRIAHASAGAYVDQLTVIGAIASTSRTACSYDNAPMENFFHRAVAYGHEQLTRQHRRDVPDPHVTTIGCYR